MLGKSQKIVFFLLLIINAIICIDGRSEQPNSGIQLQIVVDEKNFVPLAVNNNIVLLTVSVLLINKGYKDVLLDKTILKGKLMSVPTMSAEPADAHGPPQNFGVASNAIPEKNIVLLRRDEFYGRYFTMSVDRNVLYKLNFTYNSEDNVDPSLWKGMVQSSVNICLPVESNRSSEGK